MKVSQKDVAYVADLASLELTETERQRMVRDLNSILGYIDRLNEQDTTDAPTMTQISSVQRSRTLMREDELLPCLSHEEAMENAPEADQNFFKVPKVIDR